MRGLARTRWPNKRNTHSVTSYVSAHYDSDNVNYFIMNHMVSCDFIS